ncbi:MAG: hypothetical protein ABW022_24635 [Actinoplanes sp.]
MMLRRPYGSDHELFRDSVRQFLGRAGSVLRLHERAAGRPRLEDARVTKIWAGSNEIMKELIGRDLGF